MATALALVAYRYLDEPPWLRGTGFLAWRVPVDAAEALRRDPPPGRMWNSFNYGGYLLYALAPEQKVFIDGRNDTVYPDAFLAATLRAEDDGATMAAQVARYDVGYAVVECTSLRARRFLWLYHDPGWALTYLDDVAAVLVRRTPASADYIARHGYAELSPDDALVRASHPERDPRREAFAEEVRRNARESPRSARAQVLLALVALSRGEEEVHAAARARALELAAERGATISVP